MLREHLKTTKINILDIIIILRCVEEEIFTVKNNLVRKHVADIISDQLIDLK